MGETQRIKAGAPGAAFGELERSVHAALETYSNVRHGAAPAPRVGIA